MVRTAADIVQALDHYRRSDVLQLYARLLPHLQLAARHHGYALLVHGSRVRDFDLVAVPWVSTAVRPIELVQVVCALTGGVVANQPRGQWGPHGRRSWAILLRSEYVETVLGWVPCYLDLSIMPVEHADTP